MPSFGCSLAARRAARLARMGAIRCATAQFQHRASDKAYNLEVIERFAEDAARGGARIVVFPEMCVTGY